MDPAEPMREVSANRISTRSIPRAVRAIWASTVTIPWPTSMAAVWTTAPSAVSSTAASAESSNASEKAMFLIPAA